MPRIAVVNKERCNPQGCGGYLCIRVCPVNREEKDCIIIDTDKKVKIDEGLCTGCGICPNRCPFDAIDIINLPEQLAQPVHRYGRNGFHLYKLPTPLFGQVIGILGKNALGKTTALKIIAGMIQPNLGQDQPPPWEELAKHYKGSEAQLYFEKLSKGQIKASYKPQQVDLIPKTTRGKVKDLLNKVNETGKLNDVITTLGISRLLESDISTLSGGELQRVAIAASTLKKADVYMIDEPTSYLDIKQRLATSTYLRTIPTPTTATLIVEHDLLILDAMCDLIHLMYGKDGSYGVVSLPKTTRVGINDFLDGFIRDENMRIRDRALTFTAREPPTHAKKTPVLCEWTDLKTQLGSFTLTASQGKLHKQTIYGILGENGIGKTTFVKVLAGILQTQGTITPAIKVSYKPQYIQTDSDDLVATQLHHAMQQYEIQLIRPLKIKDLLLKSLNTLSGGELQRVAIAQALSQPADLYLLDEPSAYLDVEQRLATAKVIKEAASTRGTTILVVDHDLMFMDYLADNIIVFTGEPGKNGTATGPYTMEEGMNRFLRELNITVRREKETQRPRINKPESRLDREQKEMGRLYYS